MGRLISAGSIAYEQLDFFVPAGSVNRVNGIVPSALQMTMFVNNVAIAWPIVDGSAVADSSVSAGRVYFNEIAANPGFYNVRFFPDRVGFYRLVFLYSVLGQEVVREYDVLAAGVLRPSTGGLVPSTSRC